MRILSIVVVIVLLCLSFAGTAFPRETLSELNQKVRELYRQGRYQEAIEVARRSLRLAEETHVSDHPAVATSLNNLALLYHAQGKHSEAESLFKRALEIKEKASD